MDILKYMKFEVDFSMLPNQVMKLFPDINQNKLTPKVIGIHAHSNATSRRWPIRYWQSLFDHFSSKEIIFEIFG